MSESWDYAIIQYTDWHIWAYIWKPVLKFRSRRGWLLNNNLAHGQSGSNFFSFKKKSLRHSITKGTIRSRLSSIKIMKAWQTEGARRVLRVGPASHVVRSIFQYSLLQKSVHRLSRKTSAATEGQILLYLVFMKRIYVTHSNLACGLL